MQSGQKRKKEKDNSDKPKKPRTAYMLFCAANREIIKKENPEVTFSSINKILGNKWKVLSKEEKEKYEVAIKDEVTNYKVALAHYKEEHPEGNVKKKRKHGPENKGPKPPLSAFFHFSREVRVHTKNENPKASFGDMSKIIGQKWQALSKEELAKFKEMAETDKARYKHEKELLNKTENGNEKSSETDTDTEDERTQSDEDAIEHHNGNECVENIKPLEIKTQENKPEEIKSEEIKSE